MSSHISQTNNDGKCDGNVDLMNHQSYRHEWASNATTLKQMFITLFRNIDHAANAALGNHEMVKFK